MKINLSSASLILMCCGLFLSSCSSDKRPAFESVIRHGEKDQHVSPGEEDGKVVQHASPQWMTMNGAGIYKVGKPYKVNGNWYFPKEDYQYDEIGMASWYGPDFHQNKTANGEVFDMHMISAAHKTLPLPSVVRVTNLDNGRSLIVRVNDRGPFVNDRIIDLSRKAADLLGFLDKGTTKVRVELLPQETMTAAGIAQSKSIAAGDLSIFDPQETQAMTPAKGEESASHPSTMVSSGVVKMTSQSPPPLESSSDTSSSYMDVTGEIEAHHSADKPSRSHPGQTSEQGSLVIQAGAFSKLENAEATSKTLNSLGSVKIYPAQHKDGTTIYRVRIGPYADTEDAKESLKHVHALGLKDAKVLMQ